MDDLKKYLGKVIVVWCKELKNPFKGALLECGSESITVDDMKGRKVIFLDAIRSVDV